MNKISKAAGELNGMLVSLDDETRRWMWRVGSRSRWKIETADLFRRLAASRKASLAEVPVGVFTDGSLLFNAIDLAIQDLRSVVEETINEGRESGPTKGRPPGKSEVTTVRLTAAGEIGAIYRDLTGERPKRVVKKVSRKGVRGGYASQEGGPWHSFLSAMEDEIFGDHRGVEARAREVARGMDKNPAAYWSI